MFTAPTEFKGRIRFRKTTVDDRKMTFAAARDQVARMYGLTEADMETLHVTLNKADRTAVYRFTVDGPRTGTKYRIA